MSANVISALWITLIGMGLVFIAILLLWGGMALLVRVTAEREEEAAPEPQGAAAESAAAQEDLAGVSSAIPEDALLLDRKRRAAAAAVAVAIAMRQKKISPARDEAPAGMLSPWQVVHRAGRVQARPKPSREKVDR